MQIAKNSEKYLSLLTSLFITFSIVSVAVGYKLISINGIILSGAALAIPFRYLLGDIITEVYGYKTGKMQIFNLFVACIVFSIFCTFIVNTPSPANWPYEASYRYVLGNSLKITLVALSGVLLGMFLNIFILIKLKFSFKINSFILRAVIASCLGDLLQYSLVISILYHTHLSDIKIIKLILSDYISQISFLAILTFPANIIMAILKKLENQTAMGINPFKKP